MPSWIRTTSSGDAPPLAPGLPRSSDLALRWSRPGRLVFAGPARFLLEEPDGSLVALDQDGREAWDVAISAPAPGPSWDEEDAERSERLGWAVAPWGAVRLDLSFESELELSGPRRNRRGWRGQPEVVGRRDLQIEAELTVVVPGPHGWSAPSSPDVVHARAGLGQALADGEIAVERWEDSLLALSLDPAVPEFGVRWRDEAQEWATYYVSGAPGLSAAVGPAGWAADPDEQPFGRSGLPTRARESKGDVAFDDYEDGQLTVHWDSTRGTHAVEVRRASPADPDPGWRRLAAPRAVELLNRDRGGPRSLLPLHRGLVLELDGEVHCFGEPGA